MHNTGLNFCDQSKYRQHYQSKVKMKTRLKLHYIRNKATWSKMWNIWNNIVQHVAMEQLKGRHIEQGININDVLGNKKEDMSKIIWRHEIKLKIWRI